MKLVKDWEKYGINQQILAFFFLTQALKGDEVF